MPSVTGDRVCLAYMPRWTYDFKQGKCIHIIYGGCGGTENLFRTQAQCEARCPAPITATPRPIIDQPWSH